MSTTQHTTKPTEFTFGTPAAEEIIRQWQQSLLEIMHQTQQSTGEIDYAAGVAAVDACARAACGAIDLLPITERVPLLVAHIVPGGSIAVTICDESVYLLSQQGKRRTEITHSDYLTSDSAQLHFQAITIANLISALYQDNAKLFAFTEHLGSVLESLLRQRTDAAYTSN